MSACRYVGMYVISLFGSASCSLNVAVGRRRVMSPYYSKSRSRVVGGGGYAVD
jgi:hypothetical protein